MTTATANTEGQEDLTGTDTGVEEGRKPTDHILTGQEGDEAVDPAAVEAAMADGWKKVGPDARRNAEEEDITDLAFKEKGKDEGDDTVEGAGTGEDTLPGANADEEQEIPGLGMKPSQVKAQFAEMEALKKSVASTSGHLGHLKQLVQQAGQGKKVTAESLKRVSEEFGPEFASAMAQDLNDAGFGGGSSLDTAAIEQMVNEQVGAARVAAEREFEKKLVLRAHPDADEHFAKPLLDANGQPVMQKDKDGKDVPVWNAGPKHAAFMAFVQTLPADRQQQLFGPGGWDSSIVGRALDEFKAHEKKAATTQATQTARIQRAAVPRTGSGREVQQPASDPVLQGWNNVRGKRATGPTSAGRGR